MLETIIEEINSLWIKFEMEKEELGLQVNQLKMQIEEKEGLIDEAQMSKISSNGDKMRDIMSKEIERIK